MFVTAFLAFFTSAVASAVVFFKSALTVFILAVIAFLAVVVGAFAFAFSNSASLAFNAFNSLSFS